ncbi:MAG: hypothetical protein JXJ20_14185 [Anaerolineae bacterium]|nr:hypothetical protein [Anaerolineae bacterium]
MLRLLAVIGVTVFCVLALVIVGARWIGTYQDTTPLPLPSADGCWQGMCPLGMDALAVLTALNRHPDVVPGSAHFPVERWVGLQASIAFDYAPGGAEPQPLAIGLVTDAYYVMRPGRYEDALPLMLLGDIVQALGPPDAISVHPQAAQVELVYPARALSVYVHPENMAWNRASVLPSDPVINLVVSRADDPREQWPVLYPPTSAWRGFGKYWLQD